MKTPREILLARHQATNEKLDGIRRTAMDELTRLKPAPAESPVAFAMNWWRELILPKPQAWAGVAALWVLILALKLSTHDTARGPVESTVAVSPTVLAEVRRQKLLFAELAGLPQLPEVKPSKSFLPRPRSARRPEFLAA